MGSSRRNLLHRVLRLTRPVYLEAHQVCLEDFCPFLPTGIPLVAALYGPHTPTVKVLLMPLLMVLCVLMTLQISPESCGTVSRMPVEMIAASSRSSVHPLLSMERCTWLASLVI